MGGAEDQESQRDRQGHHHSQSTLPLSDPSLEIKKLPGSDTSPPSISSACDSKASQDDRAEELPEKIGDYKISRSLGRGGMGDVFLAFDAKLSRKIALKRIRPDKVPAL